MSGLAAALRERGIRVSCLANGAHREFERDGIRWEAFLGTDRPSASAAVIVLDSYRLDEGVAAGLAPGARLVVMHDCGEPPESASLVISVAGDPSQAAADRLTGPKYACLRPMFWDLPPREVRVVAEIVFLATGAGDPGGRSMELAAAVQAAAPGSRVSVLRGPQAQHLPAPEGVEVVETPDSLLGQLIRADLVVTAAGQTMLESMATGAPTVAFPLVANQQPIAARLAGLRGIEMSQADAASIARAVQAVASDHALRTDLAGRSQSLVDGQGARRVADAIGHLRQAAPA